MATDDMTFAELIDALDKLHRNALCSERFEGLPPDAEQFLILALTAIEQAEAFAKLARSKA